MFEHPCFAPGACTGVKVDPVLLGELGIARGNWVLLGEIERALQAGFQPGGASCEMVFTAMCWIRLRGARQRAKHPGQGWLQ